MWRRLPPDCWSHVCQRLAQLDWARFAQVATVTRDVAASPNGKPATLVLSQRVPTLPGAHKTLGAALVLDVASPLAPLPTLFLERMAKVAKFDQRVYAQLFATMRPTTLLCTSLAATIRADAPLPQQCVDALPVLASRLLHLEMTRAFAPDVKSLDALAALTALQSLDLKVMRVCVSTGGARVRSTTAVAPLPASIFAPALSVLPPNLTRLALHIDSEREQSLPWMSEALLVRGTDQAFDCAMLPAHSLTDLRLWVPKDTRVVGSREFAAQARTRLTRLDLASRRCGFFRHGFVFDKLRHLAIVHIGEFLSSPGVARRAFPALESLDLSTEGDAGWTHRRPTIAASHAARFVHDLRPTLTDLVLGRLVADEDKGKDDGDGTLLSRRLRQMMTYDMRQRRTVLDKLLKKSQEAPGVSRDVSAVTAQHVDSSNSDAGNGGDGGGEEEEKVKPRDSNEPNEASARLFHEAMRRRSATLGAEIKAANAPPPSHIRRLTLSDTLPSVGVARCVAGMLAPDMERLTVRYYVRPHYTIMAERVRRIACVDLFPESVAFDVHPHDKRPPETKCPPVDRLVLRAWPASEKDNLVSPLTRLDLDFALPDFKTQRDIERDLVPKLEMLRRMYPHVRELVMFRCAIQPRGLVRAALGDCLVRFAHLTTIDLSRFSLAALGAPDVSPRALVREMLYPEQHGLVTVLPQR
jgi:hypothetical protein